jgi:nucleoid-associated protein YgaU
MKASQAIFLLLGLSLSAGLHAQDSDSDIFPFEDFPDFDASAPDASLSAEEGSLEEDELEPFAELETLADQIEAPPAEAVRRAQLQESSPPPRPDVSASAPLITTDQLTITAPSAPDPLLSQPTNFEDFGGQESLMSTGSEFPEDIRALEDRLRSAESAYSEDRRRQEGLGEPGEGLAPSEKFARVPLRPPMSDANWVRWAGPMTQKNYTIRRGDSLWTVSERLFGNPYLWPKIWHLNASITNPHIIERGMTLNFNPGNPGSAPELAFRNDAVDPRDLAFYPLTKLEKRRTLLEVIDETLRRQISNTHPPFQFFLLDRKPEVIAKMPNALTRSGRTFFVEGDRFRLNLGDGVFPVIRTRSVTERFVRGHRVRWLGLISVKDGHAEVVRAFAEIESGNEIVKRRFQLSPLAIHRDTIGPEYRDETTLVKLDDGAETHGGHGNMMGVLFPAVGLGPRPGALLEVQVGSTKRVQALLVDRDQRFGTLWVVDGDQEISLGDKIF